MKTFLLSFNVGQIDPEIVMARVKTAPEIADWLLLTSGFLLVKTSMPAAELALQVRAAFPRLQFLAAEVDETTVDGWMPQPVWDFISGRRINQIAS